MKKSDIQRAIDRCDEDIAALQRTKDLLLVYVKQKPTTPRAKSKRRRNGEGATTDSGNMNYPPA